MSPQGLASSHSTAMDRCILTKDPDITTNIIKGTISIVAALAIIGALAAIFLAAAKQGHSLGPLNAVVQHMETGHILILFATSATVFVVDVIALIALVRSYLDKTYSKAMLDQLGVTEAIENEAISDRMEVNSYWTMTSKRENTLDGKLTKPAVYALLVKNESGHVAVSGFKTKKDRQECIDELKADYKDGKKLFQKGATYPADYIKAQIGEEAFNNLAIGKNLPKGFCRSQCVELPETSENIHLLAVVPDSEPHYYYVKDTHLDEFLKEIHHDYIDYDIAKKHIHIEGVRQVYSQLKEKEYWEYETQFGPNELFALAYRSRGGVIQFRFFKTNEQRRDFVANRFLFAHGWTDAKAAFENQPDYNLSPEHTLNEFLSSDEEKAENFVPVPASS